MAAPSKWHILAELEVGQRLHVYGGMPAYTKANAAATNWGRKLGRRFGIMSAGGEVYIIRKPDAEQTGAEYGEISSVTSVAGELDPAKMEIGEEAEIVTKSYMRFWSEWSGNIVLNEDQVDCVPCFIMFKKDGQNWLRRAA